MHYLFMKAQILLVVQQGKHAGEVMNLQKMCRIDFEEREKSLDMI